MSRVLIGLGTLLRVGGERGRLTALQGGHDGQACTVFLMSFRHPSALRKVPMAMEADLLGGSLGDTSFGSRPPRRSSGSAGSAAEGDGRRLACQVIATEAIMWIKPVGLPICSR